MKIDISTASPTQLAEFAQVHLGLDVNHRMGKDAIRAKMAAVGFTGSEIEVKDPETAAPSFNPAVPRAARKYVRIIIPNQSAPGGKDPVVVGVNGVVARIERGKEVDVPEEYVHVLENALTVQFEKDENGRPINPTMVPTHPFSVISSRAA